MTMIINHTSTDGFVIQSRFDAASGFIETAVAERMWNSEGVYFWPVIALLLTPNEVVDGLIDALDTVKRPVVGVIFDDDHNRQKIMFTRDQAVAYITTLNRLCLAAQRDQLEKRVLADWTVVDTSVN
jgi:hypothetical protein